MNIREKPVEPGVPVTGCESMKRRADGDVLIDGHGLAVWCEHRCVVVVVRYSDLNVSCVHVAWVGVLHVHRHVEERMQQRVKVDRLQSAKTGTIYCQQQCPGLT